MSIKAEIFPNVYRTCLHLPTPSCSPTGKRGNYNVIYDGQRYTLNRRRHVTDGVEKSYRICTVSGCKTRFVLHDQRMKNSPQHNHGDQQAELTVHGAKVQLKSRAATSDMSTKRIVEQTISGLDFESRAKLGCQLSCLGKMARSSRTAAKRHPPYPTSLENLVLDPPST